MIELFLAAVLSSDPQCVNGVCSLPRMAAVQSSVYHQPSVVYSPSAPTHYQPVVPSSSSGSSLGYSNSPACNSCNYQRGSRQSAILPNRTFLKRRVR